MSQAKRTKRDSPPAISTHDLLELYRPDLADALQEAGAPTFRRSQIVAHMFDRPGQSFAEATNLPLEFRHSLEKLGHSTLSIVASASSDDGATKLLLQAADGAQIETVIMRYRDRVTACISSQVGCPVGCAFCATGALGLTRNLTTAEIIDQVRAAAGVLAQEERHVSNLVYMGMGEPLLNLQSVLDSIRILTSPDGMKMAHRSISISTVGIPTGIRRLAKAEPQVNLALSLHAADDRTRALLIPEKFRHSLADVLQASWDHFDLTHRKLLVEYVLIGGVNDSVEDARKLVSLLRGHVVAVNILAWNPVSGLLPLSEAPGNSRDRATRERPASPGRREAGPSRGATAAPGATLRAPSQEAVAAFRQALLSAHIEAVVRQSKGSSIQAACGQLAAKAKAYANQQDTPR